MNVFKKQKFQYYELTPFFPEMSKRSQSVKDDAGLEKMIKHAEISHIVWLNVFFHRHGPLAGQTLNNLINSCISTQPHAMLYDA